MEGLLIKAQAITTFEKSTARKFRFSLEAGRWFRSWRRRFFS
jgi:hypothetical protein